MLLVDADLRRSSLPASYSMSNEEGLTQLLRGSASPTAVIQPTPVENLNLLAAAWVVKTPRNCWDRPRFANSSTLPGTIMM